MKDFLKFSIVIIIVVLTSVIPISFQNVKNEAIAVGYGFNSEVQKSSVPAQLESFDKSLNMRNLVAQRSGGRISGGKFNTGREGSGKTPKRTGKMRGLLNSFSNNRFASPEFNVVRGLTLFRVDFTIENQATTELNKVINNGRNFLPSSDLEDYIEGMESLSTGNIKDSIESFSDALGKNGDFSEAHVSRGLAYSRIASKENIQRYLLKAIDEFSLALNKDSVFAPDQKRYIEPLLGRGSVYMKIGDADKALEDFSKAIERNPDSYDAYFSRAGVLSEREDYEAAISDLNNALDLNLDYPAARLSRGYLRSKLEDYDRAIRDFTAVLSSQKEDAAFYFGQAYLGRGIANSKEGYEQNAYQDLLTIVKSSYLRKKSKIGNVLFQSEDDTEIHSQAYYQLGVIDDRRKETDKAINNYSQAISLSGSNTIQALYNRGIDYMKIREYGQAAEDFSRVIEYGDSRVAESLIARGQAYLELRDYLAAEEDFNAVIVTNSENAEAYLRRGISRFNLYDNNCYRDYQTAVSLQPDMPDIYRRLGDYYYVLKEYDKAVNSYVLATSLDSTLSEAYLGISKTYLQVGNYTEAVKQSTNALETNRDNHYSEAYYVRGLSNMRLEKTISAHNDLKKSLSSFTPSRDSLGTNREFDTSLSDILIANGEASFRLQSYDESIDYLTRAEQREARIEKYDQLLYFLGSDYFFLGQYEQAKRYLSLYVERQPISSVAYFAYYLIGCSNLNTSNYLSAIQFYEKARKAKSDYAEAYVDEGRAYLLLKDGKQAIKNFNEAINLKPASQTFLLRGQAYFSLKQDKAYRQAIRDFNEAEQLAGSEPNAEIFSWRARTYYKIKDYSTGSKDLAMAMQIAPSETEYINSSIQLEFFPLLYTEEPQSEMYYSSAIKAVSFNKTGVIIGNGGSGGILELRKADTGQLLTVLSPKAGRIKTLAFNSHNDFLAWGGAGSSVRIWDTLNGGEVKVFDCEQREVYSLIFSPDGKKIICGGRGGKEGNITILDPTTGEVFSTKGYRSGTVRTMAFRPGSNLFATGGSRRDITLWDMKTGTKVDTLIGHTKTVRTLAFSPDGSTLVSGGNDSTIQFWDLGMGKSVSRRLSYPDKVTSLAFSPDRKMLAVGSDNKTISIFSTQSKKKIVTFLAHKSYVQSISFSPNGKTLLTGGNDGKIKMWKIP